MRLLLALATLAICLRSARRVYRGMTMKLNCKPGDMAVVVRPFANTRCARARMGMVVRVNSCVVGWKEQDDEMVGVPAWLYDRIDSCRVCGGAIFVLADETLKPLPPEDDVWKHDYEQEEKAKRPTVIDALLDPYR